MINFNVLLSGKVGLVNYLDNGNYNLQDILLPRNIVGIDLIGTKTQISLYHALALEDCEIFSFSSHLILKEGIIPDAERILFLIQFSQILSQINMKKEYRLAILTHHHLRNRILTYLTMQANRKQSNSYTIPFSREELAAFLCVN